LTASGHSAAAVATRRSARCDSDAPSCAALIAALRLLSVRGGCSAAEIADALGASSDSVSDLLDCAARESGAVVCGADNLWRLSYPVEWLCASRIAAGIGEDAPRITVVDETHSTAALARVATDDRAHLIAAEYQHSGRGRRGRAWLAAPGGALLFSLALPIARLPADCGGLALAAGVGVLRALSQTAFGLGLKWPNDILNERGEKVGGILSELAARQGGARLSVGVGVNLEMPATLANAVKRSAAGLRDTSPPTGGGAFARNEMLAAAVCELRDVMAAFDAYGFSFFHREVCARHAIRPGGEILFSVAGGGEKRRAIYRGIGASGELLITENGKAEIITAGEIAAVIN
jgi:BirA family biotin operon repressor/biotin-[acetyl-CoA-carboxylase] ligase